MPLRNSLLTSSVVATLILLLTLAPTWQASAADGARLDIRAIKLAFIRNFAEYVAWPDGVSGGRMTLCIDQDADLFYPRAEALLNRRARPGRQFRVIAKPADASIDDCSILYIADGETRLAQRLQQTGKRPILTISGDRGFIRQGGMIQLFEFSGAMRFEISADAATRAGLSVSSKLMKLSRSYPGG